MRDPKPAVSVECEGILSLVNRRNGNASVVPLFLEAARIDCDTVCVRCFPCSDNDPCGIEDGKPGVPREAKVPMHFSFVTHLLLTASMIGNASICSTSPPGNAIRTGSLASPRAINAFSGLAMSTEAALGTEVFLPSLYALVLGPREAEARIREADIFPGCALPASSAP